MRYKLTFALGFGAGYVLGSKAGHERYQQIENAWRRFMDTPAVQEATGVMSAQAGRTYEQAKSTVTSKISETVGSKLHGDHDHDHDGHHESSEPRVYATEREFGSAP